MPESLDIHVDDVDKDNAYPLTVNLRHNAGDTRAIDTATKNGTGVESGLHRSNLSADATDQMLQTARENKDTWTETVSARYVVGCDGAHSWTRRQIGSIMEGEQTDFIW